MSSNWEQLKSAIGISSLLSIYGIVGLLVWVLGPSNIGAKIILIALLLMTWPLVVLAKHYREKRKGQEAATAAGTVAVEPAGQQPGLSAPTRAYDELTRSAEEAVQWLRSTRLGADQPGDAVYRLPWFLVIGPPASGKTSLVLSSGLDFRALPSQRHADLNLVRPTRDCEWRVTDSAVLLDTAGRYQTEGPDRDEWSALIETVRNYRKDRPLDGLLIVVSAARLLSSDEGGIEQEARLLRARLDEVIRRAEVRFPVYLVFTHADSIEGFEDFFRPLSDTERAQVWGTTIPLEQSLNAHALFDVEFDYLSDALMRRRLVRISAPAPPDEQLRVFDFPLRFRGARRKLGLFTSALFRPNPFSESPLLRGFYFTSNATDGRSGRARSGNVIPIMGRAGRDVREPEGDERDTHGLASASAPAAREPAINRAQVVGEGHFTQDLFNEVLLGDKDLAAFFQAGRQRPSRLRNVLVGLAAAFLVFIVVGLLVSFNNNKQLINDAQTLGAAVSKDAPRSDGKDSKDDRAVRAELENLDRLRDLLDRLYKHESDWRWLYLGSIFNRLGLYSGNSLNPGLREIYFESVSRRFFLPTALALEDRLKSFNPVSATTNTSDTSTGDGSSTLGKAQPPKEDELGDYYDQLKAYLMLSNNPDKAEQAQPFLSQKLSEYWMKQAPKGMEAESKRQLDFYASQASREDAPHIKADSDIVEKARGHLADYNLGKRYYKRITTEIEIPSIKLDTILDDKRGGLQCLFEVRGAFTRDGYEQMIKAIEDAPEKAKEDDWVVGKTAKDQPVNVDELKRGYLQDYVQEWRQFLESITIEEFDNLDDAKKKLSVLAQSNSPLEKVMDKVAHETNITGGGGTWWWPFGSKKVAVGNTKIEQEFRPIIEFVLTESEQKPMSMYTSSLKQLRDDLNKPSIDQIAALNNTQAAIGDLLQGFETPPAIAAAGLLKQPLDRFREMIGGAVLAQIEKEWKGNLRQASMNLETRFPFNNSSPSEASLDDLARFLNPVDGELTRFVKDGLKDYFDDDWKPKKEASIFSQDFVRYLDNARRLQKALFPEDDKKPGFACIITLQNVRGPDVILEINGKRLTPDSQPETITWPSQQGATGAKILRGDEALRKFEGHWWLFKMFVEGNPRESHDQYELRLDWATVKLQPNSSTNDPFERKLFTELRAPDSTR